VLVLEVPLCSKGGFEREATASSMAITVAVTTIFIPRSQDMTLDKVKTLRAAEKFLEIGKIPAAIKEYCKIVEEEPDDFTTLNILGDLHVRVGNHTAAISCFRRNAEHYREQGFAFRAIAMFRKIDRLQPNDVEIATSLADLYAQEELVVEARSHYLVVANAYAKSGDTQAGLGVLSKIADLDPKNTDIRLKLGESYIKEGMPGEAAVAFNEAGKNLSARNDLDAAVSAYMRALAIDPVNLTGLSGLLATHTARGTAYEATETIAHASATNPDNLELLSLLASAYIDAEDAKHAEAATSALVTRDPSAYLRFLDVARMHLRVGGVDGAVGVVTRIVEQMLEEREDQQLLEMVNELLTRDADNVQALRLLVRVHWWQRDAENLRAALDRMAEAAQAAGLADDERYALTQLTRLAPEDAAYAARLNELGGAAEEAAAEALPDFGVSAHGETALVNDFAIQAEDMPAPADEGFEWNSVADEAKPRNDAAAEMHLDQDFSFEAVVAQEFSPSADAESGVEGDDDRKAAVRAQELESVDFYIAQGYADIAIDTLDLLETQFGKHPDIELRRRQLKQGAGDSSAVLDEPKPVTSRTAEPVTEFSFTPETIDRPAAVASPPIVQSPAIDAGLAEIFEEFRVSSEAENDVNGDYETHYNLGLAYQEMDLFEEALEEFQIAIGIVSPNDGTPRYLQCCNLLGHCFMQKGVPNLAVQWFNKGLSSPNTSDDERQALRFDLAAAYELAGDLNQAKSLFTEIYGVNVSYRGVNERLKSLESRMV
jgi:tetratricopeptide (TPR) repeat protein